MIETPVSEEPTRNGESIASDLGYGLLFFTIGACYALLFVELVKDGLWGIAIIGGFGWFAVPILILMGVFGLARGIKSLAAAVYVWVSWRR